MRFDLQGDPLRTEEETRDFVLNFAESNDKENKEKNWVDHARYLVDVDFSNIKHLGFLESKDSQDPDCYELEVMIELKVPASCRKRFAYKEKRSCINKVKSPFNMHTQNLFLNYWNLNQCFYLKGKANKRDFYQFMSKLKQTAGEYCPIKQQLQAEIMDKESAFQYLMQLLRRSVNINAKIDKLRLPLRLAIMHLLSYGKVSIFDTTFDSFISVLSSDSSWNSEKYEDYTAYLIDQIGLKLKTGESENIGSLFASA